jgi:Ca-activated chloride channel family protein
MPVDVDEKTLQKIADMTNGQYFRATNNRTLKQIYAEIDKLEKTRIEVKAYRSYTELFYGWAGLGGILLLLETGLAGTYLRKNP